MRRDGQSYERYPDRVGPAIPTAGTAHRPTNDHIVDTRWEYGCRRDSMVRIEPVRGQGQFIEGHQELRDGQHR